MVEANNSNKPVISSGTTSAQEAAKKISIDDFEFYKCVGEGSFGQVYLAL